MDATLTHMGPAVILPESVAVWVIQELVESYVEGDLHLLQQAYLLLVRAYPHPQLPELEKILVPDHL